MHSINYEEVYSFASYKEDSYWLNGYSLAIASPQLSFPSKRRPTQQAKIDTYL